jgi:ATP-binding cassette subfamily F protein 3
MIQLKNLRLLRGSKTVLEGAQLSLHPGEKVALVGHNGAGKSSLFALLQGRLHPDIGDVSVPAQWLLAEVAQNMPETEDSATTFVVSGDLRLMQAMQVLSAAEAAHANPTHAAHADSGLAMAEAHRLIEEAGGFDAQSRAQAMLLGLGFKLHELDAPVNSFSGGWRMRLQLARALMCPADLLLLDEPTNHLDLDALVWLESWLKRYSGMLIIISHDREFLDATTRVTVHLENATLTRYSGNYSFFESQRAERLLQQQAAFSKQQDRIAHLTKFVDRFRAQATKAKQAQSRLKALERMERIAPVLTASSFDFEFRKPDSLPNPILTLKNLACGYPAAAGESKVILQNVQRSVLAGQRIGILGANGRGKSTLIKTIAGLIPPVSGHLQPGKGLVIGYFAQQELDVLRAEESPMQHMVRLSQQVSPQAREQELRDFLGGFRFLADMVHQAVGTLSGGEKARLVLAMLVWQRPNLLLLDEPTNHLDLTTREALAFALNTFEGTVMLVSHDRALLRAVCEDFWLVANATALPFEGDLDDYQQFLLEESRQAQRQERDERQERRESSDPNQRREEKRLQAQARQQSAQRRKPLQQEQLKLDKSLATCLARKQVLEDLLADPATYERQDLNMSHIQKELFDLSTEIENAEMRWLELEEQITALDAAPTPSH